MHRVGGTMPPRPALSSSDRGQGRHGQGQGRNVTSSMTSSSSGPDRPPKPAKPKNLWSRDVGNGDHVTESTGRRREPAERGQDVRQTSSRFHCEQQATWTVASHDNTLPSQQTYRQNSLDLDAEQPTQWTTTSISPTESIETVSLSRTSNVFELRQSDNGVEVTCGQTSPRCNNNQQTHWTAESIQQSHHDDSPGDSDETTGGQSSLGCNDNQLARETESSRGQCSCPSG